MVLLGITSAFYVVPAIYHDYVRLDKVELSRKPGLAVGDPHQNYNKFAANAVVEIRRKAEEHMQHLKVCQMILCPL